MFEEIRQRVQEGRWEIVGGWWIQPDCNIPSGESFVRQGLYGQRYFKEKFGTTAQAGYNVDSFGHNGTLPQILRLSDMDRYVFLRPAPHEKGLPSRLFWWEADDGSRVLAYRLPFEYCTKGKEELDKHVRRVAGELRQPIDQLMCFYGVGNHGGGPTIENLQSIQRLNASPDMPKLIFSSPNRFFAAIEQQSETFPVVHGDLQHHASGCYAAHSGIKRWNRQAEWALTTAEKWAAIASITTGLPYPKADFTRAWQDVLFNQFHDILAGTSIESAYDDARNLYGEALAIADRALNAATLSLAWSINIPTVEDTTPIIVFNPHAWAHKAIVEMEFGRFSDEHGLVDETGQPVAVQRIQSEATARGRNRLCFVAELPPLGYRVFHVVHALTPVPPPVVEEGNSESEQFTASDTMLENRRFRIAFDPQTGYISSLYDKQEKTEAFISDAALPVVSNDQSDTWSHNVFSFRDEVGCFRATSVRLVEHGPVRSVLRVTSEYGQSRLVQDFALYAELDYVEVNALVDWQEQWKALKLRFPVNAHFHHATAEIPFGAIDRFANGEEDPCQSWVDVSGASRATDEPYGVSIINDSKYSYDIFVRDIGMTVLRSPIYAHHEPVVPEPDRMYSFIDQGAQRFRYAIYPHADGWEEAGTVRVAAELNQRLYVLIGTYHPDGTLPPIDTFVAVDQSNIVVTALKQAEDNDDLVLRCYESTKTATDATIRLPHWERTIETSFRPGEIKTFRIPRDAAATIVEVNLLEWSS